VMQVPWFPPDPVPFGSNGFSLLARIETSTTPPYGMTFAETSAVPTNIRSNNNIARLNITVLAASAGVSARAQATTLVANEFAAPQEVTLQAAAGEGAVELTLPSSVMRQWEDAGSPGRDVTVLGGGRVEIAPGGKLEGIELAPGQSLDVPTRTPGGKAARIAQLGVPGDPAGVAAQTAIEPVGQAAAPALGQGKGLILPQFLRSGEKVSLRGDSVGDPRRFASATLFVDGRAVETRRRPPFDFSWSGETPGQRELRIEATDKAGVVASISRVVTVAANLPPEAKLTAPEDLATFTQGTPIKAEATASDQDGKVARVDFYVTPMSFFADPIPVGSDSSAPYAVTINDLGTGMWMVYAVAVDRAGVEAQSIPVHIMVMLQEGRAHPKP
jgi:FtsP/CotA-like multicopper oxidase with cupredoxin domain